MKRARLEDYPPHVRKRLEAALAAGATHVEWKLASPDDPRTRVCATPRRQRYGVTTEVGEIRFPSKAQAAVYRQLRDECAANGWRLYRQNLFELYTLAPDSRGRPSRIEIDFVIVNPARPLEWRAVDAKRGKWRSREWRRGKLAWEAWYRRKIEEREP